MKKNGALILIAAVVLLALLVGVVSGIRGSGETDISFAPENFVTRPVRAITEGTPHGEISVGHIEVMNDRFYDRFPFSYQEMRTAAWLVEELLSMGYTWDDIEVQEFSLEGVRPYTELAWIMDVIYFVDSSPFLNLGTRASHRSQNVILTVPGQSEETIIVGAHYDSVMYPGASDNASGTALLLESAQRMRDINQYYTIVYIFFGAEEGGLFGAFYYVNSLTQREHDNILFMLNADVLLDGADLFYMAGYDAGGQSGANHITETWDSIAQDMYVEHGINLIPWPVGIFGGSDQLAFLPWGHTVMFLLGMDLFEGWSADDGIHTMLGMTRVLHSPRDDVHYINRAWPGKIDANMQAFSLFLEALLLASYN